MMDGLPRRTIEGSWWFHGQTSEKLDVTRPVFFSSDWREARDRGHHMFCAWISDLDVFDTGCAASIDAFMEKSGWPLTDPWDGAEYHDAASFLEACSQDTWAPFEELGLPPACIVYEGGVRNLCLTGEAFDVIEVRKVPAGPLFAVLPSARREEFEAYGIGPAEAASLTLREEATDVSDGHDLWEIDLDGPAAVPVTPGAAPETAGWRAAGTGIPASSMRLSDVPVPAP